MNRRELLKSLPLVTVPLFRAREASADVEPIPEQREFSMQAINEAKSEAIKILTDEIVALARPHVAAALTPEVITVAVREAIVAAVARVVASGVFELPKQE